jgi:hypothetical protein
MRLRDSELRVTAYAKLPVFVNAPSIVAGFSALRELTMPRIRGSHRFRAS